MLSILKISLLYEVFDNELDISKVEEQTTPNLWAEFLWIFRRIFHDKISDPVTKVPVNLALSTQYEPNNDPTRTQGQVSQGQNGRMRKKIYFGEAKLIEKACCNMSLLKGKEISKW